MATLALAACGSDAAKPSHPTWIGPTAEGGTVVIVDDGGSTSFTNGIPDPINHIDQLEAARDCAGLRAEIGLWLDFMDDGGQVALKASAYAQHAADAVEALGCNG